MFRGVTQLSIDSKGRMAIPSRHRELLSQICEGQLVITIDTEERCLLIYPNYEWDKIQKKIEALPSFNPAARRIQRLLIGHATDVDMDGNGRILLSQPLRDYAGLEKKAVLLGQGKKLELWDEESWAKRRDDYLVPGVADELPEEMMNISL